MEFERFLVVRLGALICGLVSTQALSQELRIFDNRGMIRLLQETKSPLQLEVAFQGSNPSAAKLVRIDAAQGEIEGRMISPLHYYFFDVIPGSWRIEAITEQGVAHVFKVQVSTADAVHMSTPGIP
ncbi:MAG: hypothetical protein QY326_05890 [Bdellovibrionota bacterium]|nr:MAG: hypothetical protein QY326_05890 [Bdellovibrionota bacterium]